MTENFNDMETELRRVQRGMDPPYSGDLALRNRIVNACFRVRELRNVLFRPAVTAEAAYSDIRAALAQCAFDDPKPNMHYMIERRFHTVNKKPDFPSNSYRLNINRAKQPILKNGFKASASWANKCIFCQKSGRWSSNHTKEQVAKAFSSRRKRLPSDDNSDHIVPQYILQYKGEPADMD
ncbi:putative glycosyl [Golovinomyces cichoracearum]|uniref:Putative glycosyl n=1 Tax=Golovinomyces cichoracearum TaxID=62708 RepID=A0A420J5E9_9PEZI|nr:putative glycosyl [Golovinomyces cichoracearum]